MPQDRYIVCSNSMYLLAFLVRQALRKPVNSVCYYSHSPNLVDIQLTTVMSTTYKCHIIYVKVCTFWGYYLSHITLTLFCSTIGCFYTSCYKLHCLTCACPYSSHLSSLSPYLPTTVSNEKCVELATRLLRVI